MKSRDEVSLAPCGIVAPRLAKSDFGHIDRFGYPIIALWIVSLFHRVLYTQWIYAVVNVPQGEENPLHLSCAFWFVFLPVSEKCFFIFFFCSHCSGSKKADFQRWVGVWSLSVSFLQHLPQFLFCVDNRLVYGLKTSPFFHCDFLQSHVFYNVHVKSAILLCCKILFCNSPETTPIFPSKKGLPGIGRFQKIHIFP